METSSRRQTCTIAENLDFDVSWPLDELFDEHGAVAEGGLRFRRGSLEILLHFVHVAHDAHPPPAATVGRLEDDRQAVLLTELDGFAGRRHRTGRSGDDGHAGVDGRLSGRHLVAHLLDDARRRSDEADAAVDAGLREIRPLRQETVAGMDGVDVVLLGHADYLRNGQVRLNGRQTFADEERLVGLLAMHVHLVLVRVDGHRTDAQFGTGAEHPDSDFTYKRQQRPEIRPFNLATDKQTTEKKLVIQLSTCYSRVRVE